MPTRFPYAESFFDNIEPKIAPLVSALHKKRYLTYSSCEGHDYTYRRYVGLAFSDEESRDYVVDQVKALKLWGLSSGSLTRLPTKTSTPAA